MTDTSSRQGNSDRTASDPHFARLLKNGLSLLSASTVVSLLQFLQVVVLTRYLLPEGYGAFTLVIVYVALINQFLDVRVREMTVKYGAEFTEKGLEEKASAVIRLSYLVDAATGLLSFVLVYASASWASQHLLRDVSLAPYIQLYAITLLIGTLKGTNNSVLRIFDRFKWISIYEVTVNSIELIAVCSAVWLGLGLKGVFLALICQDVFRLVVSTSLSASTIRSHLKLSDVLRGSTRPLEGRRKEIAKFLMHTNLLAYFRMLNTKVDILILGYFRTQGEVGYYKLARALASLLGRISDPFFSAILPDLSRLWASGRVAEYRKLIAKASKSMCCIILPAAVVVMLMSEHLVRWVSGPSFAAAAPVLTICIWAFAAQSIFFWTWPAAVSVHRPDYGTRVGLFTALLQICLALLLIPPFGAIGCAVALAVAYFIGQPLLAIFIMRVVRSGDSGS